MSREKDKISKFTETSMTSYLKGYPEGNQRHSETVSILELANYEFRNGKLSQVNSKDISSQQGLPEAIEELEKCLKELTTKLEYKRLTLDDFGIKFAIHDDSRRTNKICKIIIQDNLESNDFKTPQGVPMPYGVHDAKNWKLVIKSCLMEMATHSFGEEILKTKEIGEHGRLSVALELEKELEAHSFDNIIKTIADGAKNQLHIADKLLTR